METIFAQCSAYGKAGIAVFRISGPESFRVVEKITKTNIEKFTPKKLYLKKIINPRNGNIIDEAMVVVFKNPASFTGEDSAEIYLHGSIAIIKIMNQLLESFDRVRLAEAGEFARRSFLNNKMDLTAAEGLADLIEAETDMQHKQAIAQMGGSLEKKYSDWRQKLLEAISLIEAYIDFPEEEIPNSVLEDFKISLENLKTDITKHLDDNNRGERLRNGIKLAILGSPNVGKSSLLNLILDRQIAIVSDIAGTTRDVIEAHIDISGYPITIHDTAGIRSHTNDIIEQEGIKRAKQSAQAADIKLLIFDASNNDYQMNDLIDLIDENTIIIFNKIDINNDLPDKINEHDIIKISIKNNINIELIYAEIVKLCEKLARPSEDAQITRARHRSQLEKALQYLSECNINGDLLLLAEDLRMSMRAIISITGIITVDEILGQIFSSFCIGK